MIEHHNTHLFRLVTNGENEQHIANFETCNKNNASKAPPFPPHIDEFLLKKIKNHAMTNTAFPVNEPGAFSSAKFHVFDSIFHMFKASLQDRNNIQTPQEVNSLLDYVLCAERKILIVACSKADLSILLGPTLDFAKCYSLSCLVYIQGACLVSSLKEWEKAVNAADVIVLTIFALLEVLRHGFFSIKKIHTLILDDVSNANKSHPYCVLMKEFILPLKSILLSKIYVKHMASDPSQNIQQIYEEILSNAILANFPQIVCFTEEIHVTQSSIDAPHSQSALMERQKILQKIEYLQHAFQCGTLILDTKVELFLDLNVNSTMDFPLIHDAKKTNIRITKDLPEDFCSAGSHDIDQGFLTHVTNLYRWFNLFYPSGDLLDISDYRGTLAFLEIFDIYGSLLKKKKGRFEAILEEFGIRAAHGYLVKLELQKGYTDAVVCAKMFETSAYGPYHEENPVYERYLRTLYENHRRNIYNSYPRVTSKLATFVSIYLDSLNQLQDDDDRLSFVFVSEKCFVRCIEGVLLATSKEPAAKDSSIHAVVSETGWKNLECQDPFISQYCLKTKAKANASPENLFIFKKEFCKDPRLLQKFLKEKPILPTASSGVTSAPGSSTVSQLRRKPKRSVVVIAMGLYSNVVTFLNSIQGPLPWNLLVDFHILNVPKQFNFLLYFYTLQHVATAGPSVKVGSFEFYLLENQSDGKLSPGSLALYGFLSQIQFLKIAKSYSALDKLALKLHPHTHLISWMESSILSQTIEYAGEKELGHLSFIVPSTGAYLSMLSASELLSKFCTYLPKTKPLRTANLLHVPKRIFLNDDQNNVEVIYLLGCSNLSSINNAGPASNKAIRSQLRYQILKVNKSDAKREDLFVCKLFLPNLFPASFATFNNQAIIGDQFSCKTTARSSAAFYGVKTLYECGVLDSNLLPSSAFLESVDTEKKKRVEREKKIENDEPVTQALVQSSIPIRVYYPIRVVPKPSSSFSKIWKIPKLLSAISWVEKFNQLRNGDDGSKYTFFLYVMDFETQAYDAAPAQELSPGFSFFKTPEKRPNNLFLQDYDVFNVEQLRNSFGILLPNEIGVTLPMFEVYLSAFVPSSKMKIDGPYPVTLSRHQFKSVLYFQMGLFKIMNGFKNNLLLDPDLFTDKDMDQYVKTCLSQPKMDSPSKRCFIETPLMEIDPSQKITYLVVPVTKSVQDEARLCPENLYASFLKFLSSIQNLIPDLPSWRIDWSILSACHSFFSSTEPQVSVLAFIRDLIEFYSSNSTAASEDHRQSCFSSPDLTHHSFDNPKTVQDNLDNFLFFSLQKIIVYHRHSDLGYRIKRFRSDLTPSAKSETNGVSIADYVRSRFLIEIKDMSQPLLESVKVETPNCHNFMLPPNVVPQDHHFGGHSVNSFPHQFSGQKSTYSNVVLGKIVKKSSLVLGKAIIHLDDDKTVFDAMVDNLSYSLKADLSLQKNESTVSTNHITQHSLLVPELLAVYPITSGHYFLSFLFPTWLFQVQRFLLMQELLESNSIFNSMPLKPEFPMFLQALTAPINTASNDDLEDPSISTDKSFDYERLEFLGDSVLKFAVSLDLFLESSMDCPNLPSEAELTLRRSKLISNANLFSIGISLFSLHEYANIVGFSTFKAFFPPHICFLIEAFLQERDHSFSCTLPIRPTFDECASWLDLSLHCENAGKKDFSSTDDTQLDDFSPIHLQAFYATGILRQLGSRYSNKVIPDMMEALIGAFYVSTGLPNTRIFLQKIGLLRSMVSEYNTNNVKNYINENLNNVTEPVEFSLFERHETRLFDKINYINQIFSSSELSSLIYTFGSEQGFCCSFSDTLDRISQNLNYHFKDPRLALLAVIHPSLSPSFNFERLEFLGDAVLDLVITRYFYEKYPNLRPNELTMLRSASVDNESFAKMLCLLRLDCIFVTKRVNSSLLESVKVYVNYLYSSDQVFIDDYQAFTGQGAPRSVFFSTSTVFSAPKILCDIFESIAGAIFLDLGCDLDDFWAIYKNIIAFYLDRNSKYKQLGLNPVKDLMEGVLKLGILPEELVFEFQHEHSLETVMHKCAIKLRGKILADVTATGRTCAKRAAASKALEYIVQGGYKEVLLG